jgi:hypothetical protein
LEIVQFIFANICDDLVGEASVVVDQLFEGLDIDNADVAGFERCGGVLIFKIPENGRQSHISRSHCQVEYVFPVFPYFFMDLDQPFAQVIHVGIQGAFMEEAVISVKEDIRDISA